MPMKTNNIKILTLSLGLIILFSFFLFMIFKPTTYEKQYKVKDFSVKEAYDSKNKYYKFTITYDNKIYPFIINHKYISARKLIDDITLTQSDNEVCILPNSKRIDFYPLCQNEEDMYSYNLANNHDLEFQYPNVVDENKTYNKITIHNLNNLNYLIFNYRGFYLLNKENKEIKLFSKDIYLLDLVYQINNYLLVADYNQNYYFNKFYLINIKNGKVKEIETDVNISFNSIFLGDYKNKVYLLDKKEEKEYAINIKKEKIEEVPYQILKDNKLVNKTFHEITNNNLVFEQKYHLNYILEDKKLYVYINDIKIKVTDQDVTKIIKIDEDKVYYLVNEDLYCYDNFNGERLLLSNFEWNFNNTNVIYIFK